MLWVSSLMSRDVTDIDIPYISPRYMLSNVNSTDDNGQGLTVDAMAHVGIATEDIPNERFRSSPRCMLRWILSRK